MTIFNFESMTTQQAESFTGGDTLIFQSPTLTPADVVVTNNGLNITTLTAGGKTLMFGGEALAGNPNIDFTSAFNTGKQFGLFVGSFVNNSFTIDNSDNGNIAYGFAGNDSITGGNGNNNIFGGDGNDTVNGGEGHDNLFGGAGNDRLSAGNGNDHIYGYQLVGGDPTTDGDDTLNGGGGNDYIQGNAGNDFINNSSGSNRLNGGQGDDTILGASGGNDTINGNKGNDQVRGFSGNNSVRGGQGNDLVTGDDGNDTVLGDLGNDTIAGGPGLDLITGGDGADVFNLFGADAAFATTGTLAFLSDTITDFVHGTDKLDLSGSTLGATADQIRYADAGITLSTVGAAYDYAITLLGAHAGNFDVAALQVGADTYLFYNADGSSGTIDAMVKLANFTASTFASTDVVGGT